MTRTYITAADGTLYEGVSARTALRRKVIARTIGGVALIGTALFLSAAIIGLQKAAIAPAPQAPKVADYNDGWDDALANIADLTRTPAGKSQTLRCVNTMRTANDLHTCLDRITTPRIAPAATSITAMRMADAQKACRKAPKGALGDCLALYLRNAWYDRNNYSVAGPALVKDCISQYKGRELADCLKQPLA